MTERPVECGQCKKGAKVVYKEMVGRTVTTTEMCSDCPILLKKLHGMTPTEASGTVEETPASLVCSKCHTSLEAVKMGNLMGCTECYALFGDLLVQELFAEDKIPPQLEKATRNQPLHVGKTPGYTATSQGSNRLTSLNESLNEALKRENYEEAAWLRDQIKELTEKKDESA